MMYPKAPRATNKAVLEMARGMPCLLTAVHNCLGNSDTTVACHQNEGKGMAMKQSDAKTVWGCANCHTWYDQSGTPRAEKRRAFDAAHKRQVEQWLVIASDPRENAKDIAAAKWALAQL